MVLGACTDAAVGCVGFTKVWAMIYFWTSYVAIGLLFFIFFIFWKTPALEFFIALMRGKSLVLVTNRSSQGRIRTAQATAEGILEISKVGPALITPNSTITEMISGRPLYILHGEFAATVPTWWVSVINSIKYDFLKLGSPIHNSSELGNKIGLEFDEQIGKWKKKDPAKEIQEIEIKPWITLKTADLANMFPWNITPALIESRIEYALARQLKFWKTDIGRLMMYGGFFIMLIVGAFLAYKFFGGGAPQVTIVTDTTGKILGTETINGAAHASGALVG